MSHIINVTVGTTVGRKTVPTISTATLRQVLEQEGIDYNTGTTMLDGVSLGVGYIDRTFEELGVADKCYLQNIVKIDNAVQAKVFGSALVIKSAKLADVEALTKYDPEALRLKEYDEDGERVYTFMVAAEHGTYGSLTKNGAVLGDAGSTSGEGVVTIQIPAEVSDVKNWVLDNYGPALLKLRRVEEQIPAAIAGVEGDRRAIADMIEF